MLSLLCYTNRVLALIQAHKGTTDLWQFEKGSEPAEKREEPIVYLSAFIYRFIQELILSFLMISWSFPLIPTVCYRRQKY